MRQRNVVFWGGALLAVWAAIAMWFASPQTKWLVRTQAKSAAGERLAYWTNTTPDSVREGRARAAQIAAQYPDDFQTQMAVALQNAPADLTRTRTPEEQSRTEDETVARLRELLPRFSHQPILFATLLRHMAQSKVRLVNRHEDALLSRTPASPPPFEANANTPDALRKWEDACVRGRLNDPENAFFPAMEAVAYFAQNNDIDAELCLLQAAKCSYYDDYLYEETRAEWHLMEQESGAEPGAIPRLASWAAVCFWHYPTLRKTARLATVRAMQAEQAGDRERAFKLRRAVSRLGALMRVSRNGSAITTMNGEAITETSYLRPGGAPAFPDGNKWRENSRNAYIAYLNRTGHADEVRFVTFENDARKQVGAVLKAAQTLPENEPNLRSYGALTAAWAAGIGLLTNALVIFLVGVLAWAYLRLGKALTEPGKTLFGLLGSLGTGAGLFWLASHNGTLTAASLGWGLMDIWNGGENADKQVLAAGAVRFASVVGVLVPLVLFGIIRSLRRRTYLASEVASVLAKSAVPAVVILLLAHGGVSSWTLGQEAQLTNFLQHTTRGEGRYFAQQTGKTWPGQFEETEGQGK